MQYIDKVKGELKKYFNILCDNDYPSFIEDYIKTDELQRLAGIGTFCGADYQKLPSADIKYWYSRLDHSIVCALMTWHFTKDKVQTLAALFHDLGTPTFSHCVDYMLDDYLYQESAELDTKEIISNAKQIKKLLKRDNITIDNVCNITNYPVVENKKPKICVDRLDGILASCLMWGRFWQIEDVEKVYKNIIIATNEDNEPEIAFSTLKVAEKFFEASCKFSIMMQMNDDKLSMKLMGDILRLAIDHKIITVDNLYTLSEQQIIELMENSKDEQLIEIWNIFKNLNCIYGSDTEVKDKYCVSLESKKRYVNPLCNIDGKIDRIINISNQAKQFFNEYLEYSDAKYAYIDYKIN